MKWVSVDGGTRAGLLHEGGVRLLDRTLPELLAGGLAAASGEAVLRPSTPQPHLCAPIVRPPSIRDFMSFEQHVDGVSRLAEGRAAVPEVWYRQPLYYFSNPASVLGPYDDVPIPPGCQVFDLELEVAVVIGRQGSDLSVSDAERAIAGYTIMNDWSARDLQFAEMQGPLGPCKGKDSAITLGPYLVTPEELPTDLDLGMRAYINGELLGEDRLSNMAWTFPEMVAYASRGTTLHPGDVIGSGTCGDGCLAELWGRRGREAHPPLHIGDTVRVEVDGLGHLENQIVAGAAVTQLLSARTPARSAPWKNT